MIDHLPRRGRPPPPQTTLSSHPCGHHLYTKKHSTYNNVADTRSPAPSGTPLFQAVHIWAVESIARVKISGALSPGEDEDRGLLAQPGMQRIMLAFCRSTDSSPVDPGLAAHLVGCLFIKNWNRTSQQTFLRVFVRVCGKLPLLFFLNIQCVRPAMRVRPGAPVHLCQFINRVIEHRAAGTRRGK